MITFYKHRYLHKDACWTSAPKNSFPSITRTWTYSSLPSFECVSFLSSFYEFMPSICLRRYFRSIQFISQSSNKHIHAQAHTSRDASHFNLNLLGIPIIFCYCNQYSYRVRCGTRNFFPVFISIFSVCFDSIWCVSVVFFISLSLVPCFAISSFVRIFSVYFIDMLLFVCLVSSWCAVSKRNRTNDDRCMSVKTAVQHPIMFIVPLIVITFSYSVEKKINGIVKIFLCVCVWIVQC